MSPERQCILCQTEGELQQVESPAIRLCTRCTAKMQTHIPVVCTGCDTVYWLPKTADNVVKAARMSGLTPKHIMDNAMLQEIKYCKGCSVQTVAADKWVQ